MIACVAKAVRGDQRPLRGRPRRRPRPVMAAIARAASHRAAAERTRRLPAQPPMRLTHFQEVAAERPGLAQPLSRPLFIAALSCLLRNEPHC